MSKHQLDRRRMQRVPICRSARQFELREDGLMTERQEPTAYWHQRVRVVPALIVTLIAIVILMLLVLI